MLVWTSEAARLAARGRALQDLVGEVNENPHLLLHNLGPVLPFWATLLSSVIWHQPSKVTGLLWCVLGTYGSKKSGGSFPLCVGVRFPHVWILGQLPRHDQNIHFFRNPVRCFQGQLVGCHQGSPSVNTVTRCHCSPYRRFGVLRALVIHSFVQYFWVLTICQVLCRGLRSEAYNESTGLYLHGVYRLVDETGIMKQSHKSRQTAKYQEKTRPVGWKCVIGCLVE